MLIAVPGPFAVGKTTFFQQSMDILADATPYKLIVVLADHADEYHLQSEDCWKLVHDKDRWMGRKEDKVGQPYFHFMVGDPKRLWIVESARYFNGMQPYLVEAKQAHNGGLRVLIPYCSGLTMIKFLKGRCAKRNKQFRSDYWTEDAAWSESRQKLRWVDKWFKPNGIPVRTVEIGPDRSEFSKVLSILLNWCKLPQERWYT